MRETFYKKVLSESLPGLAAYMAWEHMIHGIGIDLVDIARFRGAMDRFGPRFCQRLFTAAELEYCLGQRFPERHLAARFAAKVSVIKALGTPAAFRDVEILRAPDGRPTVALRGAAAQEGLRLNVTMTHDGGFGVAEAIAEVL